MRRSTILSLMWLACAMWCAAGPSVADDPTSTDRLVLDAIRAGQTQELQAIDSLADSLSHESRLVRQSAAWALTQMGSSAADAAPELTQALADEDAKVRCAAATSLGNLGRKAWRAESALWQATLDRDHEVRCAALIALRTVSASKPSAALGALSECLQCPSADVQSEAIATAAVLHSRWDDDEKRLLVPHLARVLATANDDLRLAATVMLGDLGLPAAPAIPALASATDDLDEHVRAAALRALGRFADEVDQRWNQFPSEQRTALRRPCDLAAKALVNQMGGSSEIEHLAERFQRLSDGIQLASAEDRVPVKTAVDVPAPLESANTKSAPVANAVSDNAWQWALAGLAGCLGLWVLWRGFARRDEATPPVSNMTSEAALPNKSPAPELGSDDVESRRQSVHVLSDAALEATALLNRSLNDDDSVARWRSASAMTAVHSAAVPQLLAAVTSSDPEVRRLAVTSLRGLGANAVPPFVQALRDNDAGVRQAAAVTLGQIGLGAIDAVPQLTAALADSDARVRAAAAFALSSFGPHAMEAVPPLRAALSDAVPAVRARAAFALGQIGPAARRAGDELARLVSDPDVSVRRNSASALGGIGSDTAVAQSALRRALGDADAGVRCCVVTALGLIDAVGSAAELQRALKDADLDVQQCAAAVLGIGIPARRASEGSFPTVKVHEDNPSLALRASGEHAQPEPAQHATTLKLYCPEAAAPESTACDEHIPDATDFIAQLEDADSNVRWQASQELARLGASAVPEMIASLNHRNPEVRRLLIHALGRVGSAARSAASSLLVALHDVNGDVRCAAADCLGRLDVVSLPMVQELMLSLTDSNSEVRRYAATTLGRFGQYAREATAALKVAAISDNAAKVRVAAQAALQRIHESLAGAA